MEQKTKKQTNFVFSDYLPVILMTAFFIAACFSPLAFGHPPSFTAGSLLTVLACFVSLPILGAEHYDTFLDGAFEIGRTFAAIIGLIFILDGTFYPAGYALPMMTTVKTSVFAVAPMIVFLMWSSSSVLAGRRKRSKKMLAEARESAEETLRRSREVTEECRAALKRSDEILNQGKNGSANPA